MRAKTINEFIKFSDGMEFDTSGPLRAVHKSDGWYVVGNGMLIPVRDEEEATEYLEREKGKEEFDKYLVTGKPQGKATRAWDKYLRQ